jgi:hypothetical protein
MQLEHICELSSILSNMPEPPWVSTLKIVHYFPKKGDL